MYICICIYVYVYIYIFLFLAHGTHEESAYAHKNEIKKWAIVTPFLLAKKGDKQIGDSNPFSIDKKGVGNICTQGTWHTRQKAGAH